MRKLAFPAGFLILIAVVLNGCRYSFSGGSVPPHLKTIAIPIVQDQSGYGDPTLKDLFTQQLVDIFTSDGSLELSDRSGADALLETVVTAVQETPTVVKPGEQVAERRITVTAHVVFTDVKLRKTVWEKDFSQWGDFPSGAGPTERNEGVQEAVRKLTEDILNETVAGW